MSDNMDVDWDNHNDSDNQEDKWAETLETYKDPFMWVRANGNTRHINDLNPNHLSNAIRHLEKTMDGSPEMPAIYFNMLKLAMEKGMGITTDQIRRLLEFATKPKPVPRIEYAAYDQDTDYEKYDGVILRLVEDGDIVDLNVVNSDGELEYGVARFNGSEFIIHQAPKGAKVLFPPNI